MRNSHPLAYVAAFSWSVFAVAGSFGQSATTQPNVAPDYAGAVTVVSQVPASPVATPAQANSRVAVLSFVSTSPQATNAWIGKSVQQSLTADLLQSAPSRVQSADSAAGSSADAAAAGRQLGVNYVVFGTYSATDSDLRIIGQVVDATTGTAVSSLKVTGKLGEVFQLEDGLSRQARTAIFGQSAGEQAGPNYTVREVPDIDNPGQSYYPPNGTPAYVSSSTGYADPAQAQNTDQQYQQTYISSAPTATYSYPYYSYPYYGYSYPYYGYGYPGLSFGFGFFGGHYHYYGGGYHYSGGGGGHYYGGGGGHGYSGGGGHGGGGHR